MSQILLAIKDQRTITILTNLLKTEGYQVVSASDVKLAADLLSKGGNDLAIMSAGGGWDSEYSLVKMAKTKFPKMHIMAVIEGEPPQTSAKLAQLGVASWVEKPLKLDKLLDSVQKAVDYGAGEEEETLNLNFQLEKVYPLKDVISESRSMKNVCEMISRVASTDVAVLISGDRGTGKSTIANAIHVASRRKDARMVRVDCSAPDVNEVLFGTEGVKGAIEEANTGTLFLKEVWALPLVAQTKLHNDLQERKISTKVEDQVVETPLDLRVIASTSNNLEQLVVKGVFKSDLYKLLRVISLKIPSIKERQQDILPLVREVMKRSLGENSALPVLTLDAVKLLEKYSWPGNIHEIQRAVAHMLKGGISETITRDRLPPEILAVS